MARSSLPPAPLPPPRGARPWILLAAALAITGGLGLLAEMSRGDRSAQARELEDDATTRRELLELGWRPWADDEAAPLLERHGVELLIARRPFQLPLGNGPLSGDEPPKSVDAMASLVAEELELFPPGFLAAAGLWRVVLVHDLREDGHVIPSLPNYRHTLLLDDSALGDDAAYLRRLLQHEVFHFVDYADDSVVLRDRDWEALNEAGFDYGLGGRAMRRPDATPMREDLPGFVSAYATSALEEDKAEVFAFMMVRPAAMARLSGDDAVLKRKMAFIERAVEKLHPAMNAAFWQELETRRR